MKEKLAGGGSVGDGPSRWSTRQASLFYRRHNNKSYPCRRIPSSFGGPKVLTDADFTKESQDNMVEKLNTTTKRPSSSCDLKRKHGLSIKAKETSRRKTSLSSQGSVKLSKSEANLKRKSLNQDNFNKPCKRKPDTVRVVSKGVQKNTDKKITKEDCKNPLKTDVSNGSAQSLESKYSPAKSVSSTHFRVLMTRPCSVPVVPVDAASSASAGLQKHGTVLVHVLKKVDVSTSVGMSMLPSSKSLESFVPNLTDRNVDMSTNDKDDQNQEGQPESGLSQNTGVDKNKDEAVLETTASTKGKHDANMVADDFESDSAKLDIAKQDIMSDVNMCDISPPSEFLVEGLETKRKNENTCDISPPSEFLVEGLETRKNENSVLSADEETVEAEQESKSENVTIKRSARISERRANSRQPKIKTENLGCETFRPECNLVKVVDADYTGVNAVSKTLTHNTSNQPEKRELSASILTQPNPVKPKRTRTSTKYTQRMSWRIQPQVAPVNNINSIGVGDIVWGKVHGHPWWPGRVLAISGIRNKDTNNPWDRDAHVSWYGSNTSSIMHLHALQLFLPNFAKRHKRNKKGFYRIAVRQAQEALQAMSGTI